MRPEKFGGEGSKTSVDTFLAQFAICAEYNGWSAADKAAQLKCCLTGVAGQLLWESGTPSQLTFDELVVKLRHRFGSVGKEELYQVELKSRRRARNESLANLHQDIKRLMTLAYLRQASSSLGELVAKDYFLTALDDKEFALKAANKEPCDLDAAYRHAVRIEANEKAFDNQTTTCDNRKRTSDSYRS